MGEERDEQTKMWEEGSTYRGREEVNIRREGVNIKRWKEGQHAKVERGINIQRKTGGQHIEVGTQHTKRW